jgi:hypothetical protein
METASGSKFATNGIDFCDFCKVWSAVMALGSANNTRRASWYREDAFGHRIESIVEGVDVWPGGVSYGGKKKMLCRLVRDGCRQFLSTVDHELFRCCTFRRF